MKRSSKRILIIALLIGFLFMGISVWSAFDTIDFVRTSKVAIGTIVDHNVTEERDNNRTRTVYRPIITFKTAEGKDVVFVSGSGSEGAKDEIGQTQKVYYAADNPENVKESSIFGLWGASIVTGAIGLPFLLAGLLAIGSMHRRKKREQHLFRNGQSITAIISEVKRSPDLAENDHIPWQIFAKWKNPATSEEITFESNCIWFDPTPYVKSETVRIYFPTNVDTHSSLVQLFEDPDSYAMDTHFLPQK
ncbi:MAG: DUF3592 domain-containing protein [Deltaproteobacteria bacterium]|nr:DUF3592 domain-containing protein [Deltaproteobacteria bacterium]